LCFYPLWGPGGAAPWTRGLAHDGYDRGSLSSSSKGVGRKPLRGIPPDPDRASITPCPTTAATESPAAPNFFTINLLKSRADLLTRHIDAFREAVRRTRANKPFDIEASADETTGRRY
jgi:hypothetical protein